MSTAEGTPSSGPAALSAARGNSRGLLYAGTALAVVALLLPWWAVTKYRVYEQRSINLADPAARDAIVKDMSPEELQEYNSRVLAYEGAWLANQALNKEFYAQNLGTDFDKLIRNKENVTLRSGTSSLYGWSVWTAWFGIIFLLLGLGLVFATDMSPPLKEWAWAVPWIWVLCSFLYFALSVAFFFSVPDHNDSGYAQGISLGNYVAILAGALALTGAVFEGLKSAQKRLIDLENAPEEEEAPKARLRSAPKKNAAGG
ncbi:MAG: hypothetical protein QM775_26605 [Pirellulales bacterium]